MAASDNRRRGSVDGPLGSGPEPKQTEADVRRLAAIPELPEHDAYRRDREFKASIGVSIREGILWDQAWAAARSYYLARAAPEQKSEAQR